MNAERQLLVTGSDITVNANGSRRPNVSLQSLMMLGTRNAAECCWKFEMEQYLRSRLKQLIVRCKRYRHTSAPDLSYTSVSTSSFRGELEEHSMVEKSDCVSLAYVNIVTALSCSGCSINHTITYSLNRLIPSSGTGSLFFVDFFSLLIRDLRCKALSSFKTPPSQQLASRLCAHPA